MRKDAEEYFKMKLAKINLEIDKQRNIEIKCSGTAFITFESF